jgi:hypothetical protein
VSLDGLLIFVYLFLGLYDTGLDLLPTRLHFHLGLGQHLLGLLVLLEDSVLSAHLALLLCLLWTLKFLDAYCLETVLVGRGST